MNNLTTLFFDIIIESKENSFSCEIIIAALITAGVAAIGWIIVAYLNNQLEITKVRMPYRCKMLKHALTTFNKHQRIKKDANFNENFEKLHDNEYQILNLNIQMFGTQKEIMLWEEYSKALLNWRNNSENASSCEAVTKAYEALAKHLVKTFKDELNIDKCPFSFPTRYRVDNSEN